MRLSLTLLSTLLVTTVLLADARAHGGQYTGPGGANVGTPRGGRGSGTPRQGGSTSSNTPTWRNWWARNREEFFDVREHRMDLTNPGNGQEGYVRETEHQSATKEEVRKLIVPLLQAAVRDKSSDVRDAAAIALGRVGDVPVLDALKPLLDDNVKSVREAAIMGIGLIRHALAEQVLIEVLRDPQSGYKERGMAAIALGLSGGKHAHEALADRIGQANSLKDVSNVKMRQVEGCRALGLGLIGDPEIAGLLTTAIKKAKTRDETFTPMALTALARLDDPSATDLVLKSLGHRDNDVVRAAAILAGRSVIAEQEKDAKILVRRCAAERDKHAQYFLTISLGRIGTEDALSYLRKIYRTGRNREHRGFAALALGIAKDHESAGLMRKTLLGERDESLRAASALALALLEDRESGKVILELLEKTKNPELRADFITALAMLDHHAAIPEIRRITSEARNERLVQACGFALAAMRDAASIPTMVGILKNSGSLQVKGGMATALGRTGDRRAIEELCELVGDESETDMTRAFAIVALGLIGDKSAKSAFTRVSIDSNYALVNAEALLEVIDIF